MFKRGVGFYSETNMKFSQDVTSPWTKEGEKHLGLEGSTSQLKQPWEVNMTIDTQRQKIPPQKFPHRIEQLCVNNDETCK